MSIDYRTGQSSSLLDMLKYSPDQERDEKGRFGAGGGGSPANHGKDDQPGGHGEGAAGQHPASAIGTKSNGSDVKVSETGSAVPGSGAGGKYTASDVKVGDTTTRTSANEFQEAKPGSGKSFEAKNYKTEQLHVSDVRQVGNSTTVHLSTSDGKFVNAIPLSSFKPGSIRR